MVVSHILSPASLPNAQLSVLSYNVLLPNSIDAWWTYKMYLPPLSADQQHISSWEYRQHLLKDRIILVNADVVCLQEVSPSSFHIDFIFMKELGYDECEMFKKGRFRPATFWKSAKCQILRPPVHKDRTLLTTFAIKNANNAPVDMIPWHVLNCHLQAGKQGTRRLRQIIEGIKSVVTMSKQIKSDHVTPRLIVCGDFNGGSECGAVRFLEDGYVDETFREDGDPVTSNKKSLPLANPLLDVIASVQDREPPPTLVVPELIPIMVKDDLDNPTLSKDMVERLTRIFKRFASHDGAMNVQDVEAWLIVINGRIGRGSEFREAASQMGFVSQPTSTTGENAPNDDIKVAIYLPQAGMLTLDGFLTVYLKELQQGKYWGIAHDFALLGEPLPDTGTFSARYDRMYCTIALVPTAVLDTVSTKACPNEIEPSDHLPVAASFSAR
jgi:exonuclease III